MRRFLSFTAAGLAAFAIAVPAVAGQSGERDLSVQQHLVASQHSGHQGSIKLTAWVDHKSNVYKLGEAVNLFVKPDSDAYLTVVSVGPSGHAVQLYPNAFEPDKQVKAGHVLEIPGPHAADKIVASGKPGAEFIRVIASSRPLGHRLAFKLEGSDAFRAIRGGAKAVARDLRIVQANDIAYYDKIIRTVARTPTSATAQSSATPAPAAGQIVSTTLSPNENGNSDKRPPVLMAVDRHHYKPGDLVTMSVTTLEPCYLWVVDISSDKSATVLFPNKIMKDNRFKKAGTVVLSSASSKVKVHAAGPASHDSVYALCGRDPTPPWKNGVDFSAMFGKLDKSDPLVRSLVATSSAEPQPGAIPDSYSWTVTKLTVGK